MKSIAPSFSIFNGRSRQIWGCFDAKNYTPARRERTEAGKEKIVQKNQIKLGAVK